MRGLEAVDLVDSAKRDRWCATMADALGYSINAVFAKLADRHIDEARMTQYVSAFGFGQRLPFDLPVSPSPVDVPDSRLERARMAAGFLAQPAFTAARRIAGIDHRERRPDAVRGHRRSNRKRLR